MTIPIGTQFTHLVTTSDVFRREQYGVTKIKVHVRCKCGTEKEAIVSQLRSGRTKSCGCHAWTMHQRIVFTKGYRND